MKYEISDVVTLDDDKDYVIANTAKYLNQEYALLVNVENKKIVMYAKINNDTFTIIDKDNNKTLIEELNKLNKPVWIRQVIIPGITDTEDYLKSLKEYIKKIKNIKKIEFLPFHHMAKDKYKKLGIKNQLENIPEMDKEKCNQLYEKFIN